MTAIARTSSSLADAFKAAEREFLKELKQSLKPTLQQFERDATKALEEAFQKDFPSLFADGFDSPAKPKPVDVKPAPPKPAAPKPVDVKPAPPKPTSSAATYGQPWKPGPGQLKGADTSHWQSDATFKASVKGAQFSAIKATEGTGYTDPSFKARWNFLGQQIKDGKMTLRMAYHFLRPGNGAAQAKHFLDALGIHGKLPAGTRLVLDWEANALQDPKALKDAAKYIHDVTGLWPMVYASASQLPRVKSAVPNAPIWEAKWSSNVPTNVPFVQYADGPSYDRDVFNGDLKALRRFAGFAA